MPTLSGIYRIMGVAYAHILCLHSKYSQTTYTLAYILLTELLLGDCDMLNVNCLYAQNNKYH